MLVFRASACGSSGPGGAGAGAGERPEPQTSAVTPDPASGLVQGAVGAGAVTTYRIPGTDVRFEMVGVPGGEFVMGVEGGTAGEDESPAVRVRLSPFLIGRYEVTHDEYAIFRYADRDSDSTLVAGRRIELDTVARPSTPYEDPAFGMGGDGHPAVGMTQWAALQYARWLSEKTGEFFRLPTEAEWEMACRAGGESEMAGASGTREMGEEAWFAENSDYSLQEVGKKASNAWGLFDMLGNAAEWTLDQYDAGWYRSLAGSVAVDPWRVPERLHPRTVRGGSFADAAEELRCTARQESSLNWKRRDPQIPKSFWWNTDSPFVGFRLVRPLNPPTPEEQEAFWQMVLGE
jgi:formylglycine-generating enzyme required for sulfatase activity